MCDTQYASMKFGRKLNYKTTWNFVCLLIILKKKIFFNKLSMHAFNNN